MIISRYLWLSLSLFSLGLLPQIGMADSPTAVVRVQSGMQAYTFEQKAFFSLNTTTTESSAVSKRELEDTMLYLGTGITVFTGDFYFDLYLQSSFSGSDTESLSGASNTFAGGYQPFTRSADTDWDRTEFALTAGYQITSSFKVFTGFRNSETSFEINGSNTDLNTSVVTNFTDDIDYSQDGFFFGGSYAWDFNAEDSWLNGALSANVGITFVGGEIEEKFRFSGNPTVTSDREGDTVGLTLGLAWNGYFGKLGDNDLYYTAGVNGYRFDFEADDSSQDADFSETVTQFTFGIAMPFTI